MPELALYKVSVNAFIFRDGKLLILRRSDDEDFLPGYWETAGGGVDQGETLEQAMIREVKEEAGLDIRVGKQFSYFEYIDGRGLPSININFICEMIDDSQEADVSNAEMSEAAWVTEGELGTYKFSSNMLDVCHQAFQNFPPR
ncbi:NUDIX domain-containing protein [Candidatus Uhrbacteria bacterium]|nr:NUDIX domain-containing protein [Candidatus Uhrbacteria bacterium]